ncbi:hypothetical protein WA026_020865 [Henosepilachna vigintioctopunctata]|uniref:C2H2-type domain-containing protein n=1 Tax=Henosepilachna vigintioctopunctata TaxID=420089 RepID=A0AAW1UMC3_9CUCU
MKFLVNPNKMLPFTSISYVFERLIPLHNIGGPYTCKRCLRSFKHQASIYNHIKYTCGSSTKFCCDKCSFASKYVQSLQSHFYQKHRVVLSRKELKNYVCEVI